MANETKRLETTQVAILEYKKEVAGIVDRSVSISLSLLSEIEHGVTSDNH